VSLDLSKLPGALCHECSLQACPVVPPSGPKNAKMIVVGEAPGNVEVEQGKPFVGPSGSLLDYALSQTNISTEEVYKTNAVMCKPPNNREPMFEEVEACRPRLMLELAHLNAPVLALGRTASETLDLESFGRGILAEIEGRTYMHTYHPAYVLRTPNDAGIFLRDVKRFVDPPVIVNPKWTDPYVMHIETPQRLEEVLSQVPNDTWVSFDIETDQTRWYQRYDGTPPDPILMLQIAWAEDYAVVLDDIMLYDVPETRHILSQFFARVKTVAHNGKFDQIFLKTHLGINVHLDFDTMLAHSIIDENSKHGLKPLVYEYFGIPDYEEHLIKKYLKSRNDRYSKIPFEELSKYGSIDVILTLQLKKVFSKVLREQNRYEWPFQNIPMRGSNAFVDIEIRGIRVDVPYLQQVQKFLENKMEEETEAACKSVNIQEINLGSTQQVAVVVYDTLGFPLQRSRKLGPRSTNHEAMQPLSGRHPFIDHLQEYRRIAKMKNSYADNLLEAVDINGRVHATFLMNGTEMGRLSARNPALQTIPRPDDVFGALIRGAFIAEDGKILLIVDYSQAELRVIAAEAMEPFLIKVYDDDRDLHSEVAIGMYTSAYTKPQRVRTKMFNFSYIYGGNEYSFARDAGLPLAEAKQFVKDYNRLMPRLHDYKQEQLDKMAVQGFVQSRFGRRRHFPIITKVNMDEARKAAVHAPVAGTASDLTLMSACEVEESVHNVVLTVHDSIVLEVDINDADKMERYGVEVMEEMGVRYLPEVKWKANGERRLTWAKRPEGVLYEQIV